jgi:hypothetical protein
MPRLRQRYRELRAYTDEEKEQLLTGHPRTPSSGFGFPRRCEMQWNAIREAWDCLRGELLPAFIRANPGKRPFAWWACEAPERRHRLDGIHPFDIEGEYVPNRPHWVEQAWCPTTPKELWFGLPSPYRGCHRGTYETEYEYLARLNLLTEEELCRD